MRETCVTELTIRARGSKSQPWRFVTGLRATLNKPLKGQDERPLSLDRVGAFFVGRRPGGWI
ncbi:hypothetical protein RV134_330008 [Roseovarius sp. EC-HK134]|nr:hypothetical protein RV420_390008 [Roseovarius sp. EC-SD190]VVT24429.1 hypothetical protein RV134_330008 [Roseovarius sp. EC-HK134]